MTAPMEFEEPEAIPSSHLVRTQCRTCGRPAQCDPSMIERARCTGCFGNSTVFAPGEIQHFHPGGWKTWGPGEQAPRVPHPRPEYVGEWRPVQPWILPWNAEDLAVPAPVLTLGGVAERAGWEAWMRYARGYGIHATQGRPTSLVHSLAVACRLGTRQAFAVYERAAGGRVPSWTWRTVWLLDAGRPPFGIASSGELVMWLEARGEVGEGWYALVRDRVAGIDTAKRERDRVRKEIRKAHAEGVTAAVLAGRHGMTEEDVIKIITVRAAGKRKEVGG